MKKDSTFESNVSEDANIESEALDRAHNAFTNVVMQKAGEKIHKISTELEDNKMKLKISEEQKMSMALKDATERFESLQKTMILAEKAVDAVESEILVKSRMTDKMSKEIESHVNTEADLRIALHNSNKELKKTVEFVVSLQTLMVALKQDIKTRSTIQDRLIRDIESLELEKKKYSEKYEKLNLKIRKLENEKNEIFQNFEEQKQETLIAQREVDKLSCDVEALLASKTVLLQQWQEAMNSMCERNNTLFKVIQEKEFIENEMKSINTDTSVFTNEIKSLHQYIKNLETQVEIQNKTMVIYRQEVDKYEGEIKLLKRSVEGTRARYEKSLQEQKYIDTIKKEAEIRYVTKDARSKIENAETKANEEKELREKIEKDRIEQLNKLHDRHFQEKIETEMNLNNTKITLNKNSIKFVELERKYDEMLNEYNSLLEKYEHSTKQNEKFEIELYKHQNELIYRNYKENKSDYELNKRIEEYKERETNYNTEINKLKNEVIDLNRIIKNQEDDIKKTSTQAIKRSEIIIDKDKDIDNVIGENLALKSMKQRSDRESDNLQKYNLELLKSESLSHVKVRQIQNNSNSLAQENMLLKKKIEDLEAMLEVREIEYRKAVDIYKEKLVLTKNDKESFSTNNQLYFARYRLNSMKELHDEKNKRVKDLETEVFDLNMRIEKMKREMAKQDCLINKLTERLETKLELPNYKSSNNLSPRSTNTQYCTKSELINMTKEKKRLENDLNHATSQYASLLNETFQLRQQNKELLEHEKKLSFNTDVNQNAIEDLNNDISARMVDLTNKYFRVEGIACNLDLQLRKAYPVNEISYEYIPDIKPSDELHQAINNDMNTPISHSQLGSPSPLKPVPPSSKKVITPHSKVRVFTTFTTSAGDIESDDD